MKAIEITKYKVAFAFFLYKTIWIYFVEKKSFAVARFLGNILTPISIVTFIYGVIYLLVYIYANIEVVWYLCGKLTFIFRYRYEEKNSARTHTHPIPWGLVDVCVYYMQSILVWLPANEHTLLPKKLTIFIRNIVGRLTSTHMHTGHTHTSKKSKRRKKWIYFVRDLFPPKMIMNFWPWRDMKRRLHLSQWKMRMIQFFQHQKKEEKPEKNSFEKWSNHNEYPMGGKTMILSK